MMRLRAIPILTYHRIGEPTDDHVPTVTLESFERQLAFIARYRFRVLSLYELVKRITQHEPIGRRGIVITFDDGYEETYSIALPLLRRFGFPATVFVTPTEIGLPGFMSWEQLRSSDMDGIAVGSHTMHHTYLPLVPPAQIQQELVESKKILERQLGKSVCLLSYPVGGFTPQIQAMAQTAGYFAACTTNRGNLKAGFDLFALRRIKMSEQDRNPVLLWVKLSGYYDLFRRLERPA